MHKKFREKYGLLVRMEGMFGRPSVVMAFDPNDIETVYRTEGLYPHRMGLETFQYYRKNYRPDLFKESGGLLTE